ncbi:MAG: response regulator [Polyangiaceae bacterium]
MIAPETRRILIVDDQVEMADMIADDLSDRGYETIALSSPREALRRLATERFDALVTDVGMPEITGVALLRASLRLDPSRPVILMTAYSTIESVVLATNDGAYHYLLKPFRIDVLHRLIERALKDGSSGPGHFPCP